MTWKPQRDKKHHMNWIFIDDKLPTEGEYILGKAGEDCPVFITRLIDDEWDTGNNHKRPCYTKTEMYKTSAPVVFWKPLYDE